MRKLSELLNYDKHHICKKSDAKYVDFPLGHENFYRAKVKANMVLLRETDEPGEEHIIDIDLNVHAVRNLLYIFEFFLNYDLTNLLN